MASASGKYDETKRQGLANSEWATRAIALDADWLHLKARWMAIGSIFCFEFIFTSSPSHW
jgi:hypothetical protein